MKPVVIGGATKVVGIIGGAQQVARSLSPAIHNAAFEALELDWVYLPFPVESGAGEAVRGLAAAGVRGLNVTMPHKLTAAEAVDRLDGSAQFTRAVNTVEVRGSQLIGHNTDGEGLLRFLSRDLGVQVEGRSILVIGAGGAARSVVAALAMAGAASITVVARDGARAEELKALAGPATFRSTALATAGLAVRACDLIVNATPAGQEDEAPLIPTDEIRAGATVVDLVYKPSATRLVEEARRRGATAAGGLGMLLHQAALSFEIWTGIQPPLEVMSAAALGSLKGEKHGAD